ncbi:hypothetical protein DFQ29_001214 [Apophysomyces sp. BC1021]|nr:hypothetical protein DFQ29_001214 [Apophysomyces sp. BC1021]
MAFVMLRRKKRRQSTLYGTGDQQDEHLFYASPPADTNTVHSSTSPNVSNAKVRALVPPTNEEQQHYTTTTSPTQYHRDISPHPSNYALYQTASGMAATPVNAADPHFVQPEQQMYPADLQMYQPNLYPTTYQPELQDPYVYHHDQQVYQNVADHGYPDPHSYQAEGYYAQDQYAYPPGDHAGYYNHQPERHVPHSKE